jgi:hypothetical protein
MHHPDGAPVLVPLLVPRRRAMGAVGIGLASLALPAASAAASGGEDAPSADAVAFDPRVDFVSAGTGEEPTFEVHFAWAEGYTLTASGVQYVAGTTGATAPFDWTLTSTDVNDVALFASGSGPGFVETVTQRTKVGTEAVLTLTSRDFPSDVRTFSQFR